MKKNKPHYHRLERMLDYKAHYMCKVCGSEFWSEHYFDDAVEGANQWGMVRGYQIAKRNERFPYSVAYIKKMYTGPIYDYMDLSFLPMEDEPENDKI